MKIEITRFGEDICLVVDEPYSPNDRELAILGYLANQLYDRIKELVNRGYLRKAIRNETA